MVRKICIAMFLILFVVSAGFADEESIVSDERITTDNFTSSNHAMFDRTHMCGTNVSNTDCKVPQTYTVFDPKFHMRFWAPSGQTYNRHYLITDSAGTLLHYWMFAGYMPFGWNIITYDPSSVNFSSGDYMFHVIYQGLDGRAGVKSSFFAVR